MIDYKRYDVAIDDPIAVWQAVPAAERAFWYDSSRQTAIVGIHRLAAVTAEQIGDYPFVWYSRTFFDTPAPTVSQRWGTMGNEIVAFATYFVWRPDGAYWLIADGEEPPTVAPLTLQPKMALLEEIPHPYEEWQHVFGAIQTAIKEQRLIKAVASREVEFDSGHPVDVGATLYCLRRNNPGCYIFAYEKDGRTFLGASPEILVAKDGIDVLSYALAGTITKDGVDDEARGRELLADDKNQREHKIVVERIRRALAAHSLSVTVGITGLMELKNLFHLRTILTAHSNGHSIIEWSNWLHPTPAMGGEPKDVAMPLLAEAEQHDRGVYASPLGMIDRNGDGVLAVGIRSALVVGTKIYAYAGCGIVAGSDCESEYKETTAKLRTATEALAYE